MKQKYTFVEKPPKGAFGKWKTADGFECYTNRRDRAVAWYKNYLQTQK